MSNQLAAKAGPVVAAASVGRWATCLLGFAIPVSVVLDNTFMTVAALGWLLGAQWTVTRSVISANRVAIAALILFGLLLLGLSHGVGTFGDLGKYVDLLLLPAYLTFFQDERTRERGLQLFCIASMLAVAVSYMAYLGWLKHDFWLIRDPSYVTGFKSSITHSLIVGFAAYIFLLRARAEPNKHWRIFYIVLMLIAAHNVIFMISSRTGYVVIGILFLYFFAVSFGRRGVFLMIAAAAIIFVAAYSASTIFHQRMNAAVHEFEGWKAGTASETSIGLRLEFYQHALGAIREHPWVGWGTGSFPAAYASTITDPNMTRTTNPHNEYLLLGIQIGVLGIVSLIYLFSSEWWLSGRLQENFYRDLGRGLVLLFAVGCLFNSLLLDHTEGLMFAWLSGLVFSAPRRSSAPPPS